MTNTSHTSTCIDGGKTIQVFHKEDLINELIITRVPIILGSGIPYFLIREKTCDINTVQLKFKRTISKKSLRETISNFYHFFGPAGRLILPDSISFSVLSHRSLNVLYLD